ncbi:MAG: Ig-like domain-containing protein [Acidobacteria bacterium]|nr:Ig-like domain-containing protein [Acidobacteriota bacterium]
MSTACGGGSGSSGTVGISITPLAVSVVPGKTQQFTATVTNSTNTSVTWAVNGTVGGNSTVGTISATGLYTAPAIIPSPAAVTVTATPQANATVNASAAVSIQAAVEIVPSPATVAAGGTVQFTATVNLSSSNKNVTWQVNGVTGGGAATGTISTSGLYTAPNTFPVPAITVMAIAQADTSQSASAAVTISPPQLVISPTAVTLAGGANQAFTATSLGSTVSPAWSVSCPSTTAGGCGSITAAGLFTAPVSPPPGGIITVEASMPNGSAAPNSTTVTVQVSPATLSGAYVFALRGPAQTSGLAVAGVVSFDGNSHLTSGSLDSTGSSATAAITGGTYSLGSDGRGSATVQTAGGAWTWEMVAASHAGGLVTAVSPSGAVLTGTLDLQQLPPAGIALQGAYVISVTGATTAAPAAPAAMVGSISANGSGAIASGVLDSNRNFVFSATQPAAGSYTFSGGRGTLNLNSQSFICYAVSATRFKLLESDGAFTGAGELISQPAPPAGGFSGQSFAGRYALTMAGTAASGAPFAMGGVFTLDGGVGISNRVLDGVNQTVSDTQGSYFVTDPNTGRTTVTWNANHVYLNYVMYPRSDGGFAILETDGSAVSIGAVLPQTIASFSLTTLAGGFAFSLSGFEPASPPAPEGITGQWTFTVGQTLGGSVDVVAGSTPSTGNTIKANVLSVDPGTGRATIQVLDSSTALVHGVLVVYILDSNNALIFDSDTARLMTGTAVRQF